MDNHVDFNARIGLRVRQLREAQNLYGADIEQRTSGRVTKSQLSRLETGKAHWLPHHLEAVADALGVDPRELLPGAERENPPPAEALHPAELDLVRAVRADDALAIAQALSRSLEAVRG